MSNSSVILTERAAARIIEIAAADATAPILRVSVEGGGCSGFQYRFDIIEKTEPDDTLIKRGGACLAVDPISLPFLGGAEVDFVDELIGASFRIRNPNATASCGCGTSFSI